MEPLQQYQWCLQKIKLFFAMFAHDIFAKNDHRISKGSVAFSLFYGSSIAAGLFTFLNYGYDDASRFEGGLSMIAVAQAFTKYLFRRDLRHLVDILQFMTNVYKINSKRATKNYILCQLTAKYSQLILKILITAYIMVSILYVIPPYVKFISSGTYAPSLGLYLPGICEKQPLTLTLAFLELFNLLSLTLGTGFVMSVDCLIYTVLVHLTMISTMITGELKEFGVVLKSGMASQRDVKRRLTKIILMQLQYNENIKKLDKSFVKLSVSYIANAFLMGTFALFLIIWSNYAKAYAAVIVGIVQILLFCLFGTIVEIYSNQVSDAVAEFDWHLLPLNQQKTYLIFLHHAQRPQILYVAKIKPLNMEMSVKILRVIYSQATVLKSMV